MKIWLENEVLYLKENYENLGPKECSIYLDRTIDSIKHKAISLNLSFKNHKYDKIKFVDIVKNSRSYSDVAKKLNLPIGHGNRQTIIKYIKKYNIDINHFDFKGDNMGGKRIKIPLPEILVENSQYNRVHLKRRLYEEGFKKIKCEMCGQDETWKGKKISLILDHINGINDDNRIENLRILCPNCNATLDTHGGRNLKK